MTKLGNTLNRFSINISVTLSFCLTVLPFIELDTVQCPHMSVRCQHIYSDISIKRHELAPSHLSLKPITPRYNIHRQLNKFLN